MSETTEIQWADHTFNPWIGCTKVSPGCLNCYAEVQTFTRAQRSKGRELWGRGMLRHRTSAQMWKEPLAWNRKAKYTVKCPLCLCVSDQDEDDKCIRGCDAKMQRQWPRPRVFPSMCDWLDEEVPIEWLTYFLKLIHDTPHLDWLLLTKRPENFAGRLEEVTFHLSMKGPENHDPYFYNFLTRWHVQQGLEEGEQDVPPSNVWIGTSVEDQTRANERIPALLKIPAKVRFLSVEPLLGDVDLTLFQPFCRKLEDYRSVRGIFNGDIDWIIVGGESGKDARPCNVAWVRSIVEQCKATGVPCFVKQLGSNPTMQCGDVTCIERLRPKHKKGGDPDEWPEDLRVREFPSEGGGMRDEGGNKREILP